jgi:hypothetical protein
MLTVCIFSDNLQTVFSSTGHEIPASLSTLFATFIEKAGGVEKFFGAPGAGGGGGGGEDQ